MPELLRHNFTTRYIYRRGRFSIIINLASSTVDSILQCNVHRYLIYYYIVHAIIWCPGSWEDAHSLLGGDVQFLQCWNVAETLKVSNIPTTWVHWCMVRILVSYVIPTNFEGNLAGNFRNIPLRLFALFKSTQLFDFLPLDKSNMLNDVPE
jgi:hypothetical protein